MPSFTVFIVACNKHATRENYSWTMDVQYVSESLIPPLMNYSALRPHEFLLTDIYYYVCFLNNSDYESLIFFRKINEINTKKVTNLIYNSEYG